MIRRVPAVRAATLALCLAAPLATQVRPIVPEPHMVADLATGLAPNGDSAPQFAVSGTRVFLSAQTRIGRELWKLEPNANTPVLVRDIVPGPDSSEVHHLTDLDGNGTVVCVAIDLVHGPGLWRSDGTAAGTQFVASLPDYRASEVRRTARVGTLVFLTIASNTGVQLWRTDGTAAGTFVLRGNSGAGDLADVNGTLFFGADELWKSDGTVAGTVLVRDLHNGGDSRPRSLISSSGACYFVADTGSFGLWRSDGTAAGTTLLRDLGSSSSTRPVAAGADVYFVHDDGIHGLELWATDGTLANTRLVIDLLPGPAGTDLTPLVELGGKLVFSGQLLSTTGLWTTDGTAIGTQRLSFLISAKAATPVGNQAYLMMSRIGAQPWLCVTDGTILGTGLLHSFDGEDWASSPPVAQGNRLVFGAGNQTHGLEPWTSTGRSGATQLLADMLGASGAGSYPEALHAANEVVLFKTVTQEALWRSDGSAAGTLALGPISFMPARGVTEGTIASLGRYTYFWSSDATRDGLWRTDGTVAGTSVFHPGAAFMTHVTRLDQALFFKAPTSGASGLWRTDGTANGTVIVAPVSGDGSAVTLFDRLYFSSFDAAHGNELWTSDGAATGTTLLADIAPGTDSSNVSRLTATDRRLFFVADDHVHGRELWTSDGTASGTRLVRDLAVDSAHRGPIDLVALGAGVAFVVEGSGVWWSDGTALGTRLLAAVEPVQLLTAGQSLYFFVPGDTTRELWHSDGTPAGTRSLRRFFDLGEARLWTAATGVGSGDLLVFAASDGGGTGKELWAVRDGGTPFLVADLDPVGSSDPGEFRRVGDTLFFAATTVADGRELWALDLAVLGAVLVEPFGVGCAGSRGMPELTTAGLPQVGASNFEVRIGNARASAAAAVVLASQPAAPTTACSWLLAGVQTALPTATDVTGTASLRLPVPLDHALVGLDLYAQAAIADPGSAFLGIASLTNGLRLLVGR